MKAIEEFTPQSEFVPAGLRAGEWASLEPLYAELLRRDAGSPTALERLILDRSDLDAAAAEAASELYIRMTCHTDDPVHTQAYLDHVQAVQPPLKEAGFELDKKIAGNPHIAGLDPDRYFIYLRNMRSGIDLFRPENVQIEVELATLAQEYAQICGAMSVEFMGQEHTLPQMNVYQEDPDRAVRERAWRAVAERRFQDRERLSAIFDTMVRLRHRIALNAGFENFRDYSFRAKRRFEYTPADCAGFAAGVEATVVASRRRLQERRSAALGITSLRPWDVDADILRRPPLKPFATAGELIERTSRVFHRMEPMLGRMFDSLRSGGCLDLESRKGKAPGGYQANRDWSRQPFIFMNATGVQADVETLLHEAGHAFHAILSRLDPILSYRSEIPHEFSEVASMSMELTAHPFMDEFYPSGAGSRGDSDRSRRVHLESLNQLFPIIASVDQFQHWVYANPDHSRAQRAAAWTAIHNRYAGHLDWSGMEEMLGVSWHRVLHVFEVPFYFIEYGIAQLGALQFWRNYRRDPTEAIARYIGALELGGSRTIAQLYASAGLTFDMGPGMIARLWRDVDEELGKLAE
ncbi:MAG: M3 family oligoendopeptidase [Phycisphaerales bacterium]